MVEPLSASAPVIGPPPFVGRDREQVLLRAHLTAALAGQGSLVLIGGEAGIGKTALAEWLCAEAAHQGALVLVGRCYDRTETPPYGPWRDLFAHAPAAAFPAQLLASLEGAGVAGQAALFGQVRASLAAASARRPLVLVLDDLHWADPASLDLLRALARELAGLPLVVLVTYRADELTRRHPLHHLLPTLVREAGATRLDLRPLADAALAALVAARHPLSEADTARLVAYLRAHAEGNPFYTGELLRTLEEERLLHPAGGRWQLGDLRAVGVPPLLRQVIDARLARLGDEAVRLLGGAAVIGQVVPHDLWAAVAGGTEGTLLDTIERAVEARVLAEAPADGGYRFAHALIREALYEGLLLPRRRAWHRRIGEALAAIPHADADRVAHHFRQAGDPRAAAWLITAGELAWRGYAWLTAAERYEAALGLAEHGGLDAGRQILLLLTLAQLLRYGDPSRGIGYAEEAARLATEVGDTSLAAAALFDQGHLRCNLEDYRRGLAQMGEALPLLEALTPAEQARLRTLGLLGVAFEEGRRGVLVQWLAHAGRYREALAWGERPPGETAAATPRVLAGLGNVHAALGRPDVARRCFARVYGDLRAAGQSFQLALTLRQELNYVVVPYYADRVDERRRLADAAEAALARGRGVLDTQILRELRVALLILEGDWGEARRLALGPDDAAPDLGFWQRRARHQIGALFRAQGDTDLALRMVREALPEGPSTEPGTASFRTASAAQGLAAALALDAGDLPGARDWLKAQDRWLAWSGTILGRADGQLGWAAYHRAAGDLTVAGDHAGRALAHASDPRQPLALLAAHRTVGELAADAGRHADAATHLTAALALAEACAAPYERALTLLALAELHLATGDRQNAAARLTAARALLEPLVARPALARADTLAARLAAELVPPAPLPAGLSAREAEVLRLVARGLTNAQAAERLFLSPRTVDQHLRSIYGKLGVNSRAAATAVAIDHGLR